jgi:biofilm PGA synthesis lipoprotein PgaB
MQKLLWCAVLMLFLCPDVYAEDHHADQVMILCYHDIPKEVVLDEYGVDQASFVRQLEYLKTHDYHFVSLNDVIKANRHEKELPKKAVLLTFDDEYLSFYEFVYPVLQLYGVPAILSVETKWVDHPPVDMNVPLMNWEQIKEVAASNLVTIADHTHNLHEGVIYNPQGNVSWAAVSRNYDSQKRLYESDEEYLKRVKEDIVTSKKIIFEKTGVEPHAVSWPYGAYNMILTDVIKQSGFDAAFTLDDKVADVSKLYEMPRYVLTRNPALSQFIKAVRKQFKESERQRIVQADLDLIYDPDPAQQEKNLNAFIERIFRMKVSAVYLQAFSDDDGDGNVSSVYFPNRVLPMKADLFNRVANQLSIRAIQVYAWMPVLSVVLPDKKKTEALRVMSTGEGKQVPSRGWYARLSPFSEEAEGILVMLYEDMAKNARISGVLFQDDGYLNDFEDFNPAALDLLKKITGNSDVPYNQWTHQQKEAWIKIKTERITGFTMALKKAVLQYRPQALFARTLYAEVLLHPESEEWFAQNYQNCLDSYDYVVMMAYPRMEKVERSQQWLQELVKCAKRYPQGIEKTVFKVQTYDWQKKKWIGATTVLEWLRTLVSSGAYHIAYYPDDYTVDEPAAGTLRTIMSTEYFAFKRKLTAKDITVVK